MRLGSAARTALLLTALMVATACGSPEAGEAPRPADSASPPPRTLSPDNTEAPSPSAMPGDGLRIEISVEASRLTATLRDTPASRDLLAQLPLTLTMRDFGSMEKVAELPTRLSTDGEPSGADPNVGDIGYYAPWNNLVLYYGDQTRHDGIVLLGSFDDGTDPIRPARDAKVTVRRID